MPIEHLGRTGFQHLAFSVPARADVHLVHDWVRGRGDEVIHPPQGIPRVWAHLLRDVLPRPARVLSGGCLLRGGRDRHVPTLAGYPVRRLNRLG
jgi:hypothetical protein